MSREYYLCWSYNSAPRDCVVDCVDEINELLKSKGIYIRTYEPEETDGYDFKMTFEIENIKKEPEKPKTIEEYFDQCLRKWGGNGQR